jgi:hypothetical protein
MRSTTSWQIPWRESKVRVLIELLQGDFKTLNVEGDGENMGMRDLSTIEMLLITKNGTTDPQSSILDIVPPPISIGNIETGM